MLWRCNWVKQRKRILNTLSFSSIQDHFTTKPSEYSPRIAPKPPLTHDNVYSYLRESPSDLKTLNYFFWCAKQNNYFHDDRAFDHMVSVVEKLTRQYNSIDRVIEELKLSGCEIKPRVFLLLLEIFWRGHIYDKAIEVYNGMNGFGYVPNARAMNMMMDVHFKLNLLYGALEIFEGIRFRNFFSFDIALCHFCSREYLVMVKIVLKMMIREGFYPNGERFGQIIRLCCRKGCVAQGFQVVGLMIYSGISVSVHVWNMLVSGCFRSGEPQKAVDLFNKMIQVGCSLNLVTYTSLIKGFMDFGMVNEAFSLLSIVQSQGLAPDIVLCNMMIQTFTRLGRFEEARNVFTSLQKRKLVADQYTFASILSSLSLSREFDLVPRIASGIGTDFDLVTGNILLNCFSKVGHNLYALKVLRSMSNKDFALDCYTFTGYLTALCRGGASREAVKMYEIIIRENKCLDAHFHTAVIDSLIELGEYTTAIHLFKRCILEKYPLDVVSYTVAMKGLVRANRIDEAWSLFHEMKEDGVSPNRRTYRTLISGLCKEKENEKVKKILRECIEEGVELDPNTKFKVISLLSRYRRNFSEFRSVFEKWRSDFTENVDVSDSDDNLAVSVG
ncbi:PREDICTED: putative pentatricopeptide repeat-containing protein At1g16830 [Camelina sativa]|uniref:Pentatricopeptide repeat-containing protein At1g16830 n=1 Tax=Camelina sativa TaxID=90675 RepID=A0ABM1QX47_CAMSA|nr:PREDICTED: putative pentatricopeptide repeat-containing protein At1g16830 [Camelina sativa]